MDPEAQRQAQIERRRGAEGLTRVVNRGRHPLYSVFQTTSRYDWPIAGPEAYPLIGRTTQQERLTLPNPADLRWMEGALSAPNGQLQSQARSRSKPCHPVNLRVESEGTEETTEVVLATPAGF